MEKALSTDTHRLFPIALGALISEFSELRDVIAGFFLPDTGLALVDRGEIHLVDLPSKRTRVVGRKGEGPNEFGHIGRATRTPQGILVWDVLRLRVALIAHDGTFLRSQGYAHAPLQDFMNAHPVAVHPDGRIIFRDGIYRRIKDYDGRTWNPASYVAVQDDDERRSSRRQKGLRCTTERNEAVTWCSGIGPSRPQPETVSSSPKPTGGPLHCWIGAVERLRKSPCQRACGCPRPSRWSAGCLCRKWERFEELLKRAAESGPVPYTPGNRFDASDPDFMDWPINEVAPAIETLLTDFDLRLCVRDYRLPDQDSVTWRVWDIDQAQLLFTARMDGEDILLDSRGDLVLVRRVDEFDVPRAVISQRRAAPGAGR